MSDYASDLGTFACYSDFGIEDTEKVISTYFQRTPSSAKMRHCMAYVALCAFYQFV